MRFLGIEIGGTKLQSAVVDQAGRVIVSETAPLAGVSSADGVLHRLSQQIERLRSREDDFAAAGVGFGGPIDRLRGVVTASFHVAGWGGFPLRDWIEEAIDRRPVIVENDSNAAAYAEAKIGAGASAAAVLYSNVGSGIGGGFVCDGRLYHGSPPGELEIGHLRVGQCGETLQDLASGWALDRFVRDQIARDPAGQLSRLALAGGATAAILGPAIAAGDAAAAGIVDAAARFYALGLSHAVHILHPDVLVLGGGVAEMGEAWRSAVARHLAGFVMEPFRPDLDVRLSALGQHVVPVGAALLAGVTGR